MCGCVCVFVLWSRGGELSAEDCQLEPKTTAFDTHIEDMSYLTTDICKSTAFVVKYD